jgi:hypothetical protein
MTDTADPAAENGRGSLVLQTTLLGPLRRPAGDLRHPRARIGREPLAGDPDTIAMYLGRKAHPCENVR